MLIKLSNNADLPALAGFAARSTWLILAAAMFTTFSVLGVDLGAILGAMGIGAMPEEVVAAGERVDSAWQMVVPLVLSIWAWVERRAPNYRLVWPWSAARPTLVIR